MPARACTNHAKNDAQIGCAIQFECNHLKDLIKILERIRKDLICMLQGICNFMPIIIDVFTRSLQGSCKILKDFEDLENIPLKFLL